MASFTGRERKTLAIAGAISTMAWIVGANIAHAASPPPLVSQISFRAIIGDFGPFFDFDTGPSLFDLNPTPGQSSIEHLRICDRRGNCLGDGEMIVSAVFLGWNQLTGSDEVRISYRIPGFTGGSSGGRIILDGHGPSGQIIPIDQILGYDSTVWKHTDVHEDALSFSTDEFPSTDLFTVDYQHVSPCIPREGPATVPGSFCPAPEPKTWAYLLVGFGLIGAALRRRGGATEPVPRTLTAADGMSAFSSRSPPF